VSYRSGAGSDISIASSPLVVAVPADLVTGALARLPGQGPQTTWRSIYNALGQGNIGLDMPDPAVSEPAQLGIAGLYPVLTSAEERQIESSGSFPADSGSLLCDAAQTDDQGDRPASTAYLVSEAALIASNADHLTEGACAALTQPPTPLTAFKLYIIAFGLEGCAEPETGPASQSLGGFANSAGGTCLPANGADLHQLLAQVLGQISTGG
jgi:hypothetical protein